MIFGPPTRLGDRAQSVNASAGEFADAARLEPFIAEKRK